LQVRPWTLSTPEPRPEGHPLWSLENVITPHMSGDTEDYPDDLGQLFVRRVGKRRVTGDGEAPRNRQH
jgi:phosphoglycerate dehydrogenase-like enzyme